MALPIGEGQTISPPFIVAYMTEAIDPQPGDKVLEIGTGSGYQAAVLSKLVREVYTIEIVASLGRKAEKTLERLHYNNVHVKVGDGYLGWPEHAPFDKIIVTCSPENVPHGLGRATQGRRPDGDSLRRAIPANALSAEEDQRQNGVGGVAADAVRADDGQGGSAAARCCPIPTRPTIENGGFESVAGDPPAPTGWHYQRQLEVVTR